MTAPLEFRIHGMDCADEVAILRREVEPIVGSPDRLGFDILRGKMLVASGTPVITADQIVRAVGRTGMRAEPWQDSQPGAAEAGFWHRRGRTVMTALSGLFLNLRFLFTHRRRRPARRSRVRRHRTLAIIRQNVALSLGAKAVFVVLTFSGAATLWAAIAADMGVSLIVIANALRLLRSVD